MLNIKESGPIDQLRHMAVHLDGDFDEGYGAAKLILDNENGQGYITTYNILKGLSVKTYNLTFGKELEFKIDGRKNNPLYFIYCLGGHWFHKFSTESEPQRIVKGQNVIVSAASHKKNTIILPANVPLKISVLILIEDELTDDKLMGRSNLSKTLKRVFTKIEDNISFKYIGGVESSLESHAKMLIENQRTDIIGRLITEGSVLHTLASHLEDHERSSSGSSSISGLSESDLQKVMALSDEIYKEIGNNYTMEKLSASSGLSPRKLQRGFQYLFGETVGNFIRNVRLEKAKELLTTTDMSISEISYSCGISSRSHFSKIFEEKFGILPKEYRTQLDSSNKTFELTYRSKAKPFMDSKEVKEMARAADKKNEELQITGCLIYYKDEFFQFLEGPKNHILNLYEKICQDNRHSDVQMLWKGVRDSRVFDQWGLGLVSEDFKKETKFTRDLGVDMRLIRNTEEQNSVSTLKFWNQIRTRLRALN